MIPSKRLLIQKSNPTGLTRGAQIGGGSFTWRGTVDDPT